MITLDQAMPRVAHYRNFPLLLRFPVARFLPAILLATVLLWASGSRLRAAWTDPTIGLPPIETLGLRELGTQGELYCLLEDARGRIFIGSNKLLLADGPNWLSFPIPNAEYIYSMAQGSDHRILVGAVNECGYFEESAPGEFRYHSLIAHLPETERNFCTVWGCGQVGRSLYFICQKKSSVGTGNTCRSSRWIPAPDLPL